MTTLEIYEDYLALKAHFTTNYSYQKYHGKIRASEKAVSYVRDKLFFQKVGKHKDPHRFLLANIIENKKAYIRNIAYDEEANRRYTEYVARIESLGYLFKQDLKKLDDDLKSNLYDSNHPKLVVLYLSKEILLETLCIVARETNIIQHWEKAYPYDPVMEEVITKIIKYIPFIEYDRPKFRKFIADEFGNR
jgi:hypothetical protein